MPTLPWSPACRCVAAPISPRTSHSRRRTYVAVAGLVAAGLGVALIPDLIVRTAPSMS